VERIGKLYHFRWINRVSGEIKMGIHYVKGEPGYKIKSLVVLVFNASGKIYRG
jgi:hypothetical protein